jgi:hypothetical protein
MNTAGRRLDESGLVPPCVTLKYVSALTQSQSDSLVVGHVFNVPYLLLDSLGTLETCPTNEFPTRESGSLLGVQISDAHTRSKSRSREAQHSPETA